MINFDSMTTLLSTQNNLVATWLRELRDVSLQNDRQRFRFNLERISEVAAWEVSKHLSYCETTVQTPLGTHVCLELEQQPIIATILRAGIPMHQGMMRFFDRADAAFVAAYRKYHRDGTFEIQQNYITAPVVSGRPLIITDAMIATGASMKLAIDALTQGGVHKPSQIHVVTAIACTIGIDAVLRRFPGTHIWAGDIDDELTARGYIVPGLGDAGDLCYGDKQQS